METEHEPKALRAVLEAAAGRDIELTFRSMFGGILAYAGGKPFASLSNRGLAIKLDRGVQEDLLAIDGARRLCYEPTDPPSKTYVLVPDAMLADEPALRTWLVRSASHVAAGPAKRPSKREP